MILDRWYKLAERYVVAIEETARETGRIAQAQGRTLDVMTRTSESNAKTAEANTRIAEAQAKAAERDHRIELPELADLVASIKSVSEVLAALRLVMPSPSESNGSEG